MNSLLIKLSLALLAVVLVVGGWLATLLAASDRWAGVAFTSIVLLLISAAFRGRFAVSERTRDFWTGFALFGMVQTLADLTPGPFKLITSAAIDQIGDHVIGPDNPDGLSTQYLTQLGHSIAAIPIERAGGMIWNYVAYVRETSKLFGSLDVAMLGGLVACHLRRHPVQTLKRSRMGRCPLLGIACLYLLGIMIGATFALHARPLMVYGSFFPKCPTSEAAHFALFNIEILAVLFAALEARFGTGYERAWWVGFALFGGAYLLTLYTALSPILPTKGVEDLYLCVFNRFVSTSQSPSVQVGGWILVDEEMAMFFRSGSSWVLLATFLPIAWLGTLASRLVQRIVHLSSLARWFDPWWVRSSIGRIMVALAVIGLFLAAVKNPSPLSVVIEGNAILGLLLMAGLQASFGPRSWRGWWWGFALVGGIDLMIGAKKDQQVPSPEMNLSSWPIHGVVARLHRAEIERRFGQPVSFLHLYDPEDDPPPPIFQAYQNSRPAVLMSICLPLAWIGGMLARWLDRRRQTSELSQDSQATSEYPHVHH